MAGVLGAWMIRNGKTFPLKLFPVLLLGVVIMTCQQWTMETFPMNSIGYTWLAFFYLSLVFLALKTKSFLFSNPLLGRLGTIAYGVYLFHGIILGSIRGDTGIPIPHEKLLTLESFILTMIVCSLSWLYFEKPLVIKGRKHLYDRAVHFQNSALEKPS